jgi:drug/metabolite transporter (DMT)-like permease
MSRRRAIGRAGRRRRAGAESELRSKNRMVTAPTATHHRRRTRIDGGGDVNKPMGRTEWMLLVILSLLWGGTFVFAEVALREVRPFTIVLGRVAPAALALNLLVVASGRRMPVAWRTWTAFLAMGALNNLIPFSLIFWGQTRIGAGLAAILNATTPLWAVLVAHLLTRDERLTANRLGGVLLGVAGVAVMIGPAALARLDRATLWDLLAQLAVIGAALSYAFAGVFGRRFRHQPPLVTATGQLTAATLLVAPLSLVLERPWTAPPVDPATWGAIAGLALLSTALAYVIYFRILAAAGATNLLLVTLLIPVSAVLLGRALLGETIDSRQLTGMALIGLGLAAIDGRLLVLLRRRLRPGPIALRPAVDHPDR